MDDLRGELNSLRKEVQILNNKINALSIKLDEIEGVNKLNLADYSKDTIKSQITPLDNISEKKNSDLTPLESIKNEKFTLLTPKNKEQTKKSFNLETSIGKNLMGILASLLIFIGVASFVALIFNNLTDAMKVILMYLFSFGLFGIGFWRVSKEKNAFSLSLISCGIGTVFISILLSNFYFHIFGDLLMFGLMVIWAFFTLFLSSYFKSSVFLFISYIGFGFSLFLGTEYVYEKTMSGLVLFGLLFALQCVFMGTVSIIKKNIDNKTNIAFFILSSILSFILVLTTNRNISFGYFTSISEMFYILMILGVLGLNFKFMKDILDKTSLKKNINKVCISICLVLMCIVNCGLFISIGGNVQRNYGYDITPAFENILNDKVVEEELPEYYEYFKNIKGFKGIYSLYYINGFEDFDPYEFECMTHEERLDYLQNFPMSDTSIETMRYVYDFAPLFLFLGCLLNLLGIELFLDLKQYKILHQILVYLLVFIGAVSIINFEYLKIIIAIIGLIPLYILLLGLSYIKKDSVLFNSSQILLLVSLCGSSIVQSSLDIFDYEIYATNHSFYLCLYSILYFITFIAAGFVLKNNYNKVSKIFYYVGGLFSIGYVVSLLGDYWSDMLYTREKILQESMVYIAESDELAGRKLVNDLRYEFETIVLFISFTIYTLFVRLSGFCRNWNNGQVFSIGIQDEERDIVSAINRIVMGTCLIGGISLLYNIERLELIKFIVLLLSFSLCFIGNRELLKKNSKILGFYVGLKITVFLNLVLNSYLTMSDAGYIYSILCLLIAVIFILLGFRNKLSSFRVYGLCLSLFSVLKLILVDISYTNSISRILSFIGSGLICFFIVWVYNKMSERLKEQIEN